MENEKFDGLFMSVVQQSAGIQGFLDAFYGFMRRKTDFFAKPDEARGMMNKPFQEHCERYQSDKRLEERRKQEAEAKKKAKQEEQARKHAKVVQITDQEAEAIQNQVQKPAVVEEAKQEVKQETKQDSKSDQEDEPGVLPINNGGITQRYSWTQTLQQLTINFFLPQDSPARQLKVILKPKSILITLRGEELISGELHATVKPDDMVWNIDTVDGRRCLIMTVDKYDQMSWWKTVMVGDVEINTKKITPENSSLSDLDGDTRNTVEKMMIDQQRKAMGQPTLEEEEKRNKLADFMKAHPEMDFSKCKFNQ